MYYVLFIIIIPSVNMYYLLPYSPQCNWSPSSAPPPRYYYHNLLTTSYSTAHAKWVKLGHCNCTKYLHGWQRIACPRKFPGRFPHEACGPILNQTRAFVARHNIRYKRLFKTFVQLGECRRFVHIIQNWRWLVISLSFIIPSPLETKFICCFMVRLNFRASSDHLILTDYMSVLYSMQTILDLQCNLQINSLVHNHIVYEFSIKLLYIFLTFDNFHIPTYNVWSIYTENLILYQFIIVWINI